MLNEIEGEIDDLVDQGRRYSHWNLLRMAGYE
jgi:hypothetical protein